MMKAIITFQSTHQVLKTEKLLQKEGVDFDIIPVPKEISSDCGMAIRVEMESIKRIEGILEKNTIVYKTYTI
jgi:hypothetical protein